MYTYRNPFTAVAVPAITSAYNAIKPWRGSAQFEYGARKPGQFTADASAGTLSKRTYAPRPTRRPTRMAYTRKSKYKRNTRSKRYTKKRNTRQRGRTYNQASRPRGTTVTAHGIPFPDTYRTVVRTQLQFTVAASTSGPIIYELNANSCNDPLGTFGSKQPLWHDNFAVLYAEYRVLACRVYVSYHNLSAAACRLFLRARFHNALALTTYASYREQPNVASKYIEGVNAASTGTFKGVKGYAKTKAVERVTNVRDSHDFQAGNSSNPNLMWHWDILIDNESTSGDMQGVITVHMTQYVEYIGRTGVTDS